ncbi:hypothetical protein BGZ93_009951 [Podila epicladia]|nr:hypothetical protein BGZ93_009951 [Podila epicladia]
MGFEGCCIGEDTSHSDAELTHSTEKSELDIEKKNVDDEKENLGNEKENHDGDKESFDDCCADDRKGGRSLGDEKSFEDCRDGEHRDLRYLEQLEQKNREYLVVYEWSLLWIQKTLDARAAALSRVRYDAHWIVTLDARLPAPAPALAAARCGCRKSQIPAAMMNLMRTHDGR